MKVLAVVVTYNRRELLSRCLDHLLAQCDAKADVLVVNNSSTDGTVEMLVGRGVDFVTQDNLGSAGGWHRGIVEAKLRGFDAVWLMDDDGFPDASSLGVLVNALTPDVACASSVVVREDAVDRFVFPFPRLDSSGLPRIFAWPRKYARLDELRKVASGSSYPFVHLFNGALVKLDAVRAVGNVNRDFFIFGDEVDFFFRLRKAGRVISALDARHYHPNVAGRAYSPEKIYYYVKNTMILNRRYFNHAWLRNILTVVAALARTGSRNGPMLALSYVFGRNAPTLAAAIRRGLAGQIGKDFNE